MKKLLTQKQKDKKQKIKQLIVGIILISLMLISTAGYAMNGNSKDSIKVIEYHGIKFTRSNNYWSFNYNGNQFNTLYNPTEVDSISVSNKLLLKDYNQKPLYIVGPLGEPALEIIRNLNPFILRVNSACISKEDCTENAPIKDISKDNIIIIQEPEQGQKESIFQQEKAVFITAYYENQTKYADAFLFSALGI